MRGSMMRGVTLMILIGVVAVTHAEQLVANQLVANRRAQAEQLVANQNGRKQNSLSSKLVDRLSNLRLKASSLHNVALDHTTLQKSEPAPTPQFNNMCSSDDGTAIWALGGGTQDGSWPQLCNECAHSALNVFSGIDRQAFNECLAGQVRIGPKCSLCFAEVAEYAYNHCKFACLTSPWAQGCLSCVAGFDVESCTGFDVPQATPANNAVPQAATASHEVGQHEIDDTDSIAAQTFPDIISICALALISFFMGRKALHKMQPDFQAMEDTLIVRVVRNHYLAQWKEMINSAVQQVLEQELVLGIVRNYYLAQWKEMINSAVQQEPLLGA